MSYASELEISKYLEDVLEYLSCKNDSILLYGFGAVL